MASKNDKLTPEDARRALYIDFEGQKDKSPTLLGCARKPGLGPRPRVWQAIVEQAFEPLARIDDVELLTLSGAVERILRRAEKKDCRIVAWSEHELRIVQEYCPEHLERFQSRFVNALAFAVYWRNRCHAGQKPATNALADYLVLIRYEVPESAGPGRVGETIKIVRKALERGRGAAGLTEGQLNRWYDLREHNLHDCAGMRSICLQAAREVATH